MDYKVPDNAVMVLALDDYGEVIEVVSGPQGKGAPMTDDFKVKKIEDVTVEHMTAFTFFRTAAKAGRWCCWHDYRTKWWCIPC